MRVLVVTVSDRCSRGESCDVSGPRVVEVVSSYFSARGIKFAIQATVVPDDVARIQRAITTATDVCSATPRTAASASFPHLILLTGGTGFAPRDVTPEAVRPVLDKEAPGVAQFMLHVSLQHTPFAWLSRAVAGVRKRTVIVTLPGNPKAVTEILPSLLESGLEHAVALASGGDEGDALTSPVSATTPSIEVPPTNVSASRSRSRSRSPPQHGGAGLLRGGVSGSGGNAAAAARHLANPEEMVSPTEGSPSGQPRMQAVHVTPLAIPVYSQRPAAASAVSMIGSPPAASDIPPAATPRRRRADGDADDSGSVAAGPSSTARPTPSRNAAALPPAARVESSSPSTRLPSVHSSPPSSSSSWPVPQPQLAPHAVPHDDHPVVIVPDADEPVPPGTAQGDTVATAKSAAVAWRARESAWPMVPMADALSTIEAVARESSLSHRTATLPTLRALGSVLAETVVSSFPHPPFRASIKDGYAVVASDGPGLYPVVGALVAGASPDAIRLQPKQICRVNTGGPVPEGADAVVQVEDTKVIDVTPSGEEASVLVSSRAKPGQDIRPVGIDLPTNGIVVESGTTLTSAELGLLASVGATTVTVYKKPIVAVLSTGDELEDAWQRRREGGTGTGVLLSYGKIFDSNKAMLLAAVVECGFEVVDGGIARDNVADTRAKLKAAIEVADVIITSGGVSMGEVDCVKTVLQELGATIHFGRVNMKPGKPTTFATLPGVTGSGSDSSLSPSAVASKLVFGLPGNPVSALVCFHLFVTPALRAVSGLPVPPLVVRAMLEEDFSLDPQRPEYHRCKLSRRQITERVGHQHSNRTREEFVASSTGVQASHRLLSMSGANGLVVLPVGKGMLPAGSFADVVVIGKLL